MQVTDQIISLMSQRTKGLIKLTPKIAQEIIDIVISGGDTAFVKLFRYEINTWKFYRQIPTTNEIVKQRVMEALDTKPVDYSYKFECYNSDGQLEGQIFTINSALF
jgi:hypothetical protein